MPACGPRAAGPQRPLLAAFSTPLHSCFLRSGRGHPLSPALGLMIRTTPPFLHSLVYLRTLLLMRRT